MVKEITDTAVSWPSSVCPIPELGPLLRLRRRQDGMFRTAYSYYVIDEPRRIVFIIDVAAGAQGPKRDKYEGNA